MTQQNNLIKQRCWNVGTVTKTERHFHEKHTLARRPREDLSQYCSTKGTNPSRLCCSSRRDHKITAAHLTACGGFQRVTLGHFEPSAKEYKRIAIHEQVELLSFMGEIARDDKGQSQLHVKVVVGKSDGTACGGHLFEASVHVSTGEWALPRP